MTSMNASPTNSTATAKAMPTTDVADRSGLTLEVAQNHPRRRGRRSLPDALDDTATIPGRRLRPHRFRRRNAHRAPHRRLRAQRRDREADDHRQDGDADRQMEVEGGKPEELVVEADHARAEPGASRDAGQRAGSGDHERPFDVVPGELAIRVAERLERGDLRTLQRQARASARRSG